MPFFELRASLSAKATRTVLNEKSVFVKNPSKKIVGLFDFDSAYAEWKGVWNRDGISLIEEESDCLTRKHPTYPGWSILLPVPKSRQFLASSSLGARSALSIELLFEDSDHLPGMIEQHALPCAGATVPKMKEDVKAAFAEHVKNLSASSFENFDILFKRVEEIEAGEI